MFSIVEAKLDIAFPTSVASRFTMNPRSQYTKVVKAILQYLKGFKERKIMYDGQKKLLVESYSNCDWVEDKESRKSTSGYIFMLNGKQVS